MILNGSPIDAIARDNELRSSSSSDRGLAGGKKENS